MAEHSVGQVSKGIFVVMVLALMLFAVGVLYKKYMIDRRSDPLFVPFDEQPSEPTEEFPIVLDSTRVELSGGLHETIIAQVLNTGKFTVAWPQLFCKKSGEWYSWGELEPMTAFVPVSVAEKESSGVSLAFKHTEARDILGPGSYLCDIDFVWCKDNETRCDGSGMQERIDTAVIELVIR